MNALSKWLLSALFSSALSAQAAPITYNFSGAFTTASGIGASLAGANFTGQIVYDPTAPLTFSGGNYADYASPAVALKINALGGTVSSGSAYQEVVNGTLNFTSTFGDVLRTISGDASGSGAIGGFSFIQFFEDLELNTVSPTFDLPGQMFALNDPNVQDLGIVGSGPNSSYFQGAVSCFSNQANSCGITTVPEPASWPLAGIALLALLATRRRRIDSLR